MTSKGIPQEDVDEGGDLGLGRGLKPGGLEVDHDQDTSRPQFTMLVKTPPPTFLHQNSVPNDRRKSADGDHFQLPAKARRNSMFKLKFIGKSRTEEHDDEPREDYPAFAEIPLGTSMRQQKKLFEEKMNELCIGGFQFELDTVKEIVDTEDGKQLARTAADDKASAALQRKLKKAEMEIGILRQDLELCQKQLEAKYKAILILQKQSFAIHSQRFDETKKSTKMKRKMEKRVDEREHRMRADFRVKTVQSLFAKELNKLQFKLEHNQGTLMGSQEVWSERFDRVCLENSALMATLEARSDSMRKLTNEKMGLQRERDELLALLDIQERQRYEFSRTSSVSSDDNNYNGFTSTELAVLGACHCQIQTPDPCRCALNAATLKRDITNLKEQLEVARQQKEEALVTTDAYRIAFEEQLARNRGLMRQISDISSSLGPPMSTAGKVKAALKWIIQQLNEEESVMELARQLSIQSAYGSSPDSTPSDTKNPSSGFATPTEARYVPNKDEIMSGLQHSFGALHNQQGSLYEYQKQTRPQPALPVPPNKTSWQLIAAKSAPNETFINVVNTIDDTEHVVNCHQDGKETLYSASSTATGHLGFHRDSETLEEISLLEDHEKSTHELFANGDHEGPDKYRRGPDRDRGGLDVHKDNYVEPVGSLVSEEERPLLNSTAENPVREQLINNQSAKLDNLMEKLSGSSEKELLATLIDMISERSEALAHQRLAARMLAVRTQELEKKLMAVNEDMAGTREDVMTY